LGGMTLAPEREVYPAIESRPAACLAIRAYRVLKIVAQFLFSSSKCKRTSLPTQRARRRRRIAQRAPQAERQADVKRRYWRRRRAAWRFAPRAPRRQNKAPKQ